MKSTLVRVALLVALALLAFGCNGKRLAIVNTDMVYQKSAASEKGTEYIRNVTTELEKELRAVEEKAQKAKDKKAVQAELQQALMGIQQRFNAEQQQVMTVLSEAYRKALEACRAKYGFDIIMSTELALSYDPSVDITDKVMEEMNAQPLEFKPLNAEPAAKPEEEAGKTGENAPAQK